MNQSIRGVFSPVITPMKPDAGVDLVKFVAQCRWLQSHQVGLAFLGTNSEANSLSADEREQMILALVDGGLDPARMMPGTGACDLPTAVRLSKAAVQAGCAGVLTLPPFYYKGVSDEGLFRYFSSLIEGVGDNRLRVYLYHIPPVAQVGISLNLIERLLQRYPGTIAGIKDSSGDWSNTLAMLRTFAPHGFEVFAGSETFLLDTLRNGGAGCISATANVNPEAIHRLFTTWESGHADAQQKALNCVRSIFEKYPMIPALKAAMAHWSQDPEWARVRAPLVELTGQQTEALVAELQQAGFAVPLATGQGT